MRTRIYTSLHRRLHCLQLGLNTAHKIVEDCGICSYGETALSTNMSENFIFESNYFCMRQSLKETTSSDMEKTNRQRDEHVYTSRINHFEEIDHIGEIFLGPELIIKTLRIYIAG